MNAYRFKEIMWVVIALLFIFVASGCASNPSPKVASMEPQYCYTSQEILLEDGKKVNSKTRVECNDDRTKTMFTARSGIARDCEEFTYPMNLRGQLVEGRGYACKKFSGTYEVFNPSMHR
jgi:hypothetical protein